MKLKMIFRNEIFLRFVLTAHTHTHTHTYALSHVVINRHHTARRTSRTTVRVHHLHLQRTKRTFPCPREPLIPSVRQTEFAINLRGKTYFEDYQDKLILVLRSDVCKCLRRRGAMRARGPVCTYLRCCF